MAETEADIRATPATLRQTVEQVAAWRDRLAPLLGGPVLFLGCGSSHCVGVAGARLYEEAFGAPAQALTASECRPRRGWLHVGISRTGQTTELVQALRQARQAGAPTLLLEGDAGSPAGQEAETVLPLPFATERAVVQTRFVSAALLALRLLCADGAEQELLGRVPDQVERALAGFDPAPLLRFERVVFLGRGWRHGIALAAALNHQETALRPAEAQHTMEYRHGPIATADARTLVWCFDPPGDPLSDAVLTDVRRTGAAVRSADADPLAALAQAQLLAVRAAEARGIDPDAPRHLSRAIVLPEGAR